jgi:adenosylcobinamide hydrolase
MSVELVAPSPPVTGADPAGPPEPELAHRVEAGRRWPLHVWRFGRPLRAISTGPYGGGLGERQWVLNASVPRDYDRRDPDAHIAELAAELGLTGPGAGLLTAVDVTDAAIASDTGVTVVATVGLGHPTRAAAPDEAGPLAAGTINVVAFLPAPLADAALVNAVATATEAKVQALAEAGFDATGTATDALFLACPIAGAGTVEPYGGPRSIWGARLARAVHAAVAEGTQRWRQATDGR